MNLALMLFALQARPEAPPLPDAKEELVPGLALAIEAGGLRDVRDSRLCALGVPEASASSAFVPPGPFKAVWEGFILADLGTEVVFSAQGAGTFSVTINDKPAFSAKGDDFSAVEGKPFMLRKGRNRFVARYEPPAKGDARVRLSWESEDWALEPVPTSSFSHDAAAKELRGRRREREGREIVAQRRCLKCHADDAKGMPELSMDAPSLADAGTRLRPEWTAKWIEDPRSIRPEATMPKLPGLTPQDAADLAAFLATLGAPAPAPAAVEVKAGGELFAQLRCVGCHTLPEKDPAPDRIPLRHLAAKWAPAALQAFLRAPEKHYAWIEMPNFGLDEGEAGKLAAFLLSRKGVELPAPAKGDAARGKARAAELGCAGCHAITPDEKPLPATPFRSLAWKKDCSVDHGLSAAQKDALRAFAATDLAALSRDAAPEFVERQVRALRCFACHKRDDRQDAWSELADEVKALLPPKKTAAEDEAVFEAAVPTVPPLTWTGEKLKPEWTAAFIAGKVAERPRPYLGGARMPAFPARAEGIALGLALEHGIPARSAPEPAPDPELSEVGRKLAGPNGGFDCLSCHGIGPRPATKVFEGPGPNFRLSRERLRKDYFLRWVREPLRVEPGTKMPQFFQQGRTQLTEVLEGDARRQMEALWQYLLEGPKIKPPSE
jgi:cytochrome c1